MDTLTMPARSQSTPQSAPNTKGVASVSVPANWLLTGKGRSRPAAAQVKNPKMKATPATVPASAGHRPRIRPERKPAPASRHNTAHNATVRKPGTEMVAS